MTAIHDKQKAQRKSNLMCFQPPTPMIVMYCYTAVFELFQGFLLVSSGVSVAGRPPGPRLVEHIGVRGKWECPASQQVTTNSIIAAKVVDASSILTLQRRQAEVPELQLAEEVSRFSEGTGNSASTGCMEQSLGVVWLWLFCRLCQEVYSEQVWLKTPTV